MVTRSFDSIRVDRRGHCPSGQHAGGQPCCAMFEKDHGWDGKKRVTRLTGGTMTASGSDWLSQKWCKVVTRKDSAKLGVCNDVGTKEKHDQTMVRARSGQEGMAARRRICAVSSAEKASKRRLRRSSHQRQVQAGSGTNRTGDTDQDEAKMGQGPMSGQLPAVHARLMDDGWADRGTLDGYHKS